MTSGENKNWSHVMEIDMNIEFGEQPLDDIAAQMLDGLGVPCTDANHMYIFLKLTEVVEYVTKLSAEIATRKAIEHTNFSPEAKEAILRGFLNGSDT